MSECIPSFLYHGSLCVFSFARLAYQSWLATVRVAYLFARYLLVLGPLTPLNHFQNHLRHSYTLQFNHFFLSNFKISSMNKEEHKGFLISHDCDMLGRAQQNNVFISKKVISRKLPVCRHAVYLKRRKTPNIDLVLTSILVLFLHMLTCCALNVPSTFMKF
jgi:hypothetical protein